MTISTVVTMGFGVGDIGAITRLGYASDSAPPPVVVVTPTVQVGDGSFESWSDHVKARNEEKHLKDLLRSLVAKKKKLEKKIKIIDARGIDNPGILEQRLRIEEKKDELERKIRATGFKLDILMANFNDYETEQDDEDILLLM